MKDIHLTTWTFRKKNKLTPGRKPPISPGFKVTGVIVAGSNEEKLLSDPHYIRRALLSIDIKTGFENYDAIQIEFIKKIGHTNE